MQYKAHPRGGPYIVAAIPPQILFLLFVPPISWIRLCDRVALSVCVFVSRITEKLFHWFRQKFYRSKSDHNVGVIIHYNQDTRRGLHYCAIRLQPRTIPERFFRWQNLWDITKLCVSTNTNERINCAKMHSRLRCRTGADATQAESASEVTCLFLRPPPRTGRLAWIHWIS